MGTIVIEEYSVTGSKRNPEVPITRLKSLIKRTEDATTTSAAESITLTDRTTVLRIYTEEIHRLCVVTDTTDAIYYTTEAQKWHDLSADPGDSLYYELDA